MANIWLIAVVFTAVGGFLAVFYVVMKAGIGNYPYDRPTQVPWVDPYEQTTPSVTTSSPDQFPLSHRTADPVDLDAAPDAPSRERGSAP